MEDIVREIKVNEYLTFVFTISDMGKAIKAVYDGDHVIGVKNPCKHLRCNTVFIAEMSAIAEQMRGFERAFEPETQQKN